MHALIESSVGYSLFKLASKIDTATLTPQTALNSLKLAAFLPFTSASNALDNILAVSEGIVSPALASFLDLSLTKEKDLVLAVGDANLAGNIKAQLGYLTLIIGKLNVTKDSSAKSTIIREKSCVRSGLISRSLWLSSRTVISIALSWVLGTLIRVQRYGSLCQRQILEEKFCLPAEGSNIKWIALLLKAEMWIRT
jgi:NOP5NT (NUC127) domain